MTYAQFKSEWIGRRVDYDRVYQYQCVDLILQYIKECYGIPTGVWGNAIDYWNHPSAPLLKRFDKVATQSPRTGDIVVFKGKPGNPYGHIGVADRNASGGSIVVLEQNGDGRGTGTGAGAIRLRAIPCDRVAGVLRPKATTVPKPVAVYHIVKAGETLSSIASANRMTLTQLERLNPVTNLKSDNYNVIYPGEKIRVK